MIKEIISRNKDFKTDGFMESLILILLFFKENQMTFSFSDFFENYNTKSRFVAIEKLATKYNIVAVEEQNISLEKLKQYNYPTIINISSYSNKNHYVVCMGYNNEKGFMIYDSINEKYFVKDIFMEALWRNNSCWSFDLKYT